MKFFFTVVLIMALISVSSRGSDTVFAASTTSTDNNQGQVRTSSNNGALYLTTDVNGSRLTANSPSTGTTSQASNSVGIGDRILKPAGFADNIGSYLNSVLGIVIVVCLLLVFYHFIAAGLQWITSGGDKSKTEEARNKIVNAVVGILIVSASFAVVGFVAYVLGFDSFNDALSSVSRINPS
jgi:hypothetical protein